MGRCQLPGWTVSSSVCRVHRHPQWHHHQLQRPEEIPGEQNPDIVGRDQKPPMHSQAALAHAHSAFIPFLTLPLALSLFHSHAPYHFLAHSHPWTHAQSHEHPFLLFSLHCWTNAFALNDTHTLPHAFSLLLLLHSRPHLHFHSLTCINGVGRKDGWMGGREKMKDGRENGKEGKEGEWWQRKSGKGAWKQEISKKEERAQKEEKERKKKKEKRTQEQRNQRRRQDGRKRRSGRKRGEGNRGLVTQCVLLLQESKGYDFESETDTESIAKLVKYMYDNRDSDDISFTTLVERVIQQLVMHGAQRGVGTQGWMGTDIHAPGSDTQGSPVKDRVRSRQCALEICLQSPSGRDADPWWELHHTAWLPRVSCDWTAQDQDPSQCTSLPEQVALEVFFFPQWFPWQKLQ